MCPKKTRKNKDKKPTSDLVRAPFLLRARPPSFTAAAETAAFSLFLSLSLSKSSASHPPLSHSPHHCTLALSRSLAPRFPTSQTARILRLDGSQPLPPRRSQFLNVEQKSRSALGHNCVSIASSELEGDMAATNTPITSALFTDRCICVFVYFCICI